MEPICIIIYVRKRIWYKCCIYKGSLFSYVDNLGRIADKLSRNYCKLTCKVRDGSHSTEFLTTSETKIHSLDIKTFSKDIHCRTYDDEDSHRRKGIRLKMDGYELSLFTKILMHSDYYRKNFAAKCHQDMDKRLKQSIPKEAAYVIVKLLPAKREVLDYRWNDRMLTLAMERRELENAMYWLSTLGGAFSALGDEFQHCAVMAGRISISQLWLALRLGDPLTVARCKLFLALSLMQQGRLRAARQLVQQQYIEAKAVSEVDPRLGRMCQGVWAKLRYAYQLQRGRQKLGTRQA